MKPRQPFALCENGANSGRINPARWESGHHLPMGVFFYLIQHFAFLNKIYRLT